MHIILVSNKRGVQRRLDLARPLHALVLLLALTPPLLLATLAGNLAAVHGGAEQRTYYFHRPSSVRSGALPLVTCFTAAKATRRRWRG